MTSLDERARAERSLAETQAGRETANDRVESNHRLHTNPEARLHVSDVPARVGWTFTPQESFHRLAGRVGRSSTGRKKDREAMRVEVEWIALRIGCGAQLGDAGLGVVP